jgi:hypothetical protein
VVGGSFEEEAFLVGGDLREETDAKDTASNAQEEQDRSAFNRCILFAENSFE